MATDLVSPLAFHFRSCEHGRAEVLENSTTGSETKFFPPPKTLLLFLQGSRTDRDRQRPFPRTVFYVEGAWACLARPTLQRLPFPWWRLQKSNEGPQWERPTCSSQSPIFDLCKLPLNLTLRGMCAARKPPRHKQGQLEEATWLDTGRWTSFLVPAPNSLARLAWDFWVGGEVAAGSGRVQGGGA